MDSPGSLWEAPKGPKYQVPDAIQKDGEGGASRMHLSERFQAAFGPHRAAIGPHPDSN